MLLRLFLLLIFTPYLALAEEARSLIPTETLNSLSASFSEARDEKKLLEKKLRSLRDEIAKEPVKRELEETNLKINRLFTQFERLSSGLNDEKWSSLNEQEFTLSDEVNEILKPLIQEIKDATENPREIERARTEIDLLNRKIQAAQEATKRLKKVLSITELSKESKKQAQILLSEWEEKVEEAQSQQKVLQFELDERSKQKRSLFRKSSATILKFCKTRGLNILMTILFSGTFFFAIHFIHRRIKKNDRYKKRKKGSFQSRLIDMIFITAKIFFPTVIAFLILYATGDWVLLLLLSLFMLGVLWSLKDKGLFIMERLEILLNLGPVREGERIIVHGIPWEVTELGIDSRLTNPELSGGELHMELRDLVNLHSRKYSNDEPWFPTQKGDWVILSDETYGKIICQTPEHVQLINLGGARITYPTGDFLTLSPKNLSKNFRVNMRFGIDYQYQKISTSEVPSIFREALQREMAELVGKEHLVNLKVEFAEAGASSLDYAIIADFKGEIASKYHVLQRAIHRVCVDVCNRENWEIPFTQITVHQAK